MCNSALPAACDLVPSTAGPEMLRSYRHVLWLHPDRPAPPTIADHPGLAVLTDADSGFEQVTEWLRACMPAWVEGNCLWCLSRRPGGLVLGLFNNRGVTRTAQLETFCDPVATVHLRVSGVDRARPLAVWPSEMELRSRSNVINVTLPAGGMAVLALGG